MTQFITKYLTSHYHIKRIIVLKMLVAACLILSHFYPSHFGLITNLLWLFAF